jgi:putative ABC transport system permease protein
MVTDVPLVDDAPNGSLWLAESQGISATTAPASATDQWKARISIVTPGYFDALRIPLVSGRQFVDSDKFTDAELSSPDVSGRQGVVVVNSAFVSRYFPGQDPLGRRLGIFDDQTFSGSRVIVGIVGNARARSVAEAADPAVFLPHGQHPGVFRPSIVIRSALPPERLAAALGARLRDFDPQLLVLRTRTMSEVVSGSLSRPRFNLLLVGAFALIALALSAIGIYGVVTFVVTERTREIGIRIALGARSADVRRLIVRDGMAPVLAGAAAGIAAAFGVTRGMRSLLFGVEALDPVSFAAAPVLLVAVALTACYFPARRAARLDPLIALQED